MDKPKASQIILPNGTSIELDVPNGCVPVCVKENGSSGDVRYRIQFVEDLTGSSGGSSRTVKRVAVLEGKPELIYYCNWNKHLTSLSDVYRQARNAKGPVQIEFSRPLTCKGESVEPLEQVSSLIASFPNVSIKDFEEAIVGALNLCPNVKHLEIMLPKELGVFSGMKDVPHLDHLESITCRLFDGCFPRSLRNWIVEYVSTGQIKKLSLAHNQAGKEDWFEGDFDDFLGEALACSSVEELSLQNLWGSEFWGAFHEGSALFDSLKRLTIKNGKDTEERPSYMHCSKEGGRFKQLEDITLVNMRPESGVLGAFVIELLRESVHTLKHLTVLGNTSLTPCSQEMPPFEALETVTVGGEFASQWKAWAQEIAPNATVKEMETRTFDAFRLWISRLHRKK